MDTPICVTDANTLVDRIQDIKRWIYNGQLRLVIPLSTFEQVEHLYQKSVEVKPTQPESTRPKSVGRLPRKEYPAFDINPRLAKDFLARLKRWKDHDDSAPALREFIRGAENHDAVQLQELSEQYTPWNDLSDEMEQAEPNLPPPTSWAEALRRKTNLANGLPEDSQALKGLAKPKLVARTPGSDSSPWKIKKDAPKISAKDVPADLRPLMSCALWRLHESIERNDTNQLFVLSDQSEVCNVAEKLNISTQLVQDLKQALALRSSKSEVDTFGDVEREFGVQKRVESPKINGSHVSNGVEQHAQQANGLLTAHEEITIGSQPIEESAQNTSVYRVHQAGGRTGHSTNGSLEDESTIEQESPVPAQAIVEVEQDQAAKDHSVLTNDSAASKSMWSAVVRVGSSGFEKAMKEVPAIKNERADTSTTSKAPSLSTTNADGSLNDVSEAQPVEESTPQAQTAKCKAGANSQRLPVPEQSSQPTAVVATTQQRGPDPEDSLGSDEEVVVFKPSAKRYSAQKKAVQQDSRPTTPMSQPQKEPSSPVPQAYQQHIVDRSPKLANIKSQPQHQHQSRPGSSHTRNNKIVGHRHPQPKSTPTVIDPDAFGRSFAVNPNPSSRTPRHPRPQHYTKPPVHQRQIAPTSQNPGSQSARTSPQRQSAHTMSPQNSPRQEANAVITNTASPKQPIQKIAPESRAPRAFDPTPGAGRHTPKPAPKVLENDEFVPRSAFPEVHLKPQSVQPIASEPTEFVPRSQPMQTPSQTRRKSPDVQDDGFVPRSVVPQSIYQPKISGPEYIEPRGQMPDVQYVLKSGSTRASSRGRGRLWMPS